MKFNLNMHKISISVTSLDVSSCVPRVLQRGVNLQGMKKRMQTFLILKGLWTPLFQTTMDVKKTFDK